MGLAEVIVDSSALIAVLRSEPDSERILSTLAKSAGNVSISASTLLETHIVVQRLKVEGLEASLTALVDELSIKVASFGSSQQQLAADAHRTYGKGSGHPAKLNFGDCFSYALAKERGEPLLFKGDDFTQTDIESAL
jgi:ribonuclease VapC